MTTDLSHVNANNMSVEYSGFLCLESNMHGAEQNKAKSKHTKKQGLKTCETAMQVVK
jgi:hypothetical protein